MPTRATQTSTGGRGPGFKPGDHTARTNQAKAEEALKEEEERAEQLTMARKREREMSNEVIDTTADQPRVVPVDEVTVMIDEDALSDAELVEQLRAEEDPRIQKLLGRFTQMKAREEQDVAVQGMVVSDDYWIIRPLADIDRMTYGNDGREYNFKRGQRYQVTPDIGGHLKRLGLLMNA